MKKNTLFAVVFLMFFAVSFTACIKENVIELEQDIAPIDDEVSNTDSAFVSVPVRYISLNEARQELENILAAMDFSISKSGRKRSISSGFTLSSERKSLLKSSVSKDTTSIIVHVFNFEDEGGFAFMSATTATPSLLALTEDGNIDTTKEIDNPGMIFFLESLERYLANQEPVDDSVVSLSKRSHYPVHKCQYVFYTPKGGLCKTHWHQFMPYNKYCQTTEGKRAYAGCTPIATAQLLTIFKYPFEYNGYPFKWTNMSDDNAALLIQQLGLPHNLEVKYHDTTSTESSLASEYNIPRTLKNLGFSDGGKIIDYNTEKVVEELQKGNGIVVSGKSHRIKHTQKFLGIRVNTYYSHKEGHSWLVHGAFKQIMYEGTYYKKTKDTVWKTPTEETYVLCNWGWKTYDEYEGYYEYNGYYSSGVFDAIADVHFKEDYFSLSKSNEKDGYYQYLLTALVGVKK